MPVLVLISIKTSYLSHWTSCWLHSLPSDANGKPVSNLCYLVTYNKARAAGYINKPQGPIIVEGNDLHLPSMMSSMLGLTKFKQLLTVRPGQTNLMNSSYSSSGQVVKHIPKHLIWFSSLCIFPFCLSFPPLPRLLLWEGFVCLHKA